jgi:N-acetylmuramoyl-L-alanine amidase
MLSKVAFFCGLALVLGGCGPKNAPMPQIVNSPAGKPESAPQEAAEPTRKVVRSNVPKGWLPPSQIEKKWTAIVIHHSATETGNAAIFDRMHREENHWDGVGYDFVIGNGTDSSDGQIEVTFRWLEQVAGAHCGGTPDNWANIDAVGICLVGNFNHTAATAKQMKSLSKLVQFLQKRYGISTSRVFGHSSTPGSRITDCPGDNSPIADLKQMLDS